MCVRSFLCILCILCIRSVRRRVVRTLRMVWMHRTDGYFVVCPQVTC
jgi:hypothetical protein